jgi:hypothetical protein
MRKVSQGIGFKAVVLQDWGAGFELDLGLKDQAYNNVVTDSLNFELIFNSIEKCLVWSFVRK